MPYKVTELGSKGEYEKWLNKMGESIRIISAVPSRKKWSPWTGMANMENAQTYTVTYEELTPPKAPAPQIIGKRCTNCGTANPAETKFCGNCGNPLVAPKMQNKENLCAQCGTTNPPEYKFCGSCGTPLFKPSANS